MTGQEKALVDRFEAQGHVMKRNSDGDVDQFGIDYETHNGPICEVCGEGVCWHCKPNYQPEKCPGKAEVERREKEARRKAYLSLKDEFETS